MVSFLAHPTPHCFAAKCTMTFCSPLTVGNTLHLSYMVATQLAQDQKVEGHCSSRRMRYCCNAVEGRTLRRWTPMTLLSGGTRATKAQEVGQQLGHSNDVWSGHCSRNVRVGDDTRSPHQGEKNARDPVEKTRNNEAARFFVGVQEDVWRLLRKIEETFDSSPCRLVCDVQELSVHLRSLKNVKSAAAGTRANVEFLVWLQRGGS